MVALLGFVVAPMVGSKIALEQSKHPSKVYTPSQASRATLQPKYTPAQIEQIKSDVSQEIGGLSETDLSSVQIAAQNYCYFKRVGKSDQEIRDIAFNTVDRFSSSLTETQKTLRKRVIVSAQNSANSRLCPSDNQKWLFR